jgi:hypothetical protein
VHTPAVGLHRGAPSGKLLAPPPLALCAVSAPAATLALPLPLSPRLLLPSSSTAH